MGIIVIIYMWKSIYYPIYGIICPCFVKGLISLFRLLYQLLTKPFFAPISPITMCIKHNETFSLQTVFCLLVHFQFSDFSWFFLFFYMFFVDKLFKSQSIEASQVVHLDSACLEDKVLFRSANILQNSRCPSSCLLAMFLENISS